LRLSTPILAALAVLGWTYAANAADNVFFNPRGSRETLTPTNCAMWKSQYLCGDDKNWDAQSNSFCTKNQNAPCRCDTDTPNPRQSQDTCLPNCIKLNTVSRGVVCKTCNDPHFLNPPVQRSGADPGPTPDPPGGVAPANPPSPAGHQCGSATCESTAAEDARRAEEEARHRRWAYERAQREAREGQQSTVKTASDLLEAWKGQIDRGGSTITGAEKARYASDKALVEKARAAITGADGKSNGTFTGEDALSANNPDVMRQLAMNADFHEEDKIFGNDAKETRADENQYHQLAAEAQRRADGFRTAGTLEPPAARFGSTPSTASVDLVSESGAAGFVLPGSGGRGTLTGASAAMEDSRHGSQKISRSDLEGESGAGAESWRSGSGGGLRDVLRKRLEDRAAETSKADPKAKTPVGEALGESFSGTNLTPAQRVHREISSSGGVLKPSLAEEVMGGFLNKGPEGKRFNLGAQETESEMRRLSSEEQPNDGALLGAETKNLFERVRQAHKACLARSCVAAGRR
jgi:hypothetical protein